MIIHPGLLLEDKMATEAAPSAGLMSMLGGLYPQNDVATKEIFAVLNSFVGGNRCQNLLVNLSKSSLRVILIIVINHYISKSGELIGLCKKLGWYLLSLFLYRNRSYSLKGAGIEGMMGSRLFKLNPDGEMVRGFPIYTTKTEDAVTIAYAKGIHASYLGTLTIDATTEYNRSQSPNSSLVQWDGSKYTPHAAMALFPSHNFRNLQNIVEKHILATRLLGNYNVVGILIDGEPGLGKSMAIHYLATQNSVRILRRIDLSSLQCLRTPAEKLITECYHKVAIETSTMFMFDEIDKWLEYQIQNTYSALTAAKPKTENDLSPAPIIPTFEEHSRSFRINFLYLLLSILERTGQIGACLVVFCSNNFDSIFGDIDMTHFRSLKDRFQKLTFHRCEREEIANYLRFNNSKFVNTPLYVSDLDSILVRLPTTAITYRKLNELAVLNAYDPARIINGLINLESEPPIVCSSSTFLPFAAMLPSFIPAIPPLNKKNGLKDWKCECGLQSFVNCGCGSCQYQTEVCHWCQTGDKLWTYNGDLMTFKEAHASIKPLSDQYYSASGEASKTIYIQLLECLVPEPTMISIRRSTDSKAFNYINSVIGQLRDRGVAGSFKFAENILLYDTVLRGLTYPLDKMDT